MLVRTAKCPNCQKRFTPGAGIFKLALPPLVLYCSNCKVWLKTSFSFRASWTWGQVYKLLILASCAFAIYGIFVSLSEGKSLAYACFLAVFIVVGLGFLAGIVGSLIAFIPAQIVLEPILRMLPHQAEEGPSLQDRAR